jgi:hypothetical protein
MATEELHPAGEQAHGAELPPMMPLGAGGQPGPHGADPNGDAGWLAGQAMAEQGQPTHHDQNYAGMTTNPPGSGTHAAHPYDEIRHTGQG